VGHSGETSRPGSRHDRPQQLTRLGIFVAALACLASLALVHTVKFKERYAGELGVVIPRSANPLLPQSIQDVIQSPEYDTALKAFSAMRADAVNDRLTGIGWKDALIAAEAADDFNMQVRIVRAVTGPAWPNGVCDRDTDDCLKPDSNISAHNSLHLAKFLKRYYLEQAEADRLRGRVARAFDRIDRLRRILYLVDTPLVNRGALGARCCSDLNPSYIAVAFFSQKEDWRDMTYAQSVFDYIAEKGIPDRRKAAPELLAYSDGVDQLFRDCPIRAGRTFLGLAKAAKSQALRELSAYMALRAAYSLHFKDDEAGCEYGYDEAQANARVHEPWLTQQISLPGMKSDLKEMQAVTRATFDLGAGD
jgi:hypothetical protein